LVSLLLVLALALMLVLALMLLLALVLALAMRLLALAAAAAVLLLLMAVLVVACAPKGAKKVHSRPMTTVAAAFPPPLRHLHRHRGWVRPMVQVHHPALTPLRF
jgi:hypothetical protein